QGRLRRLLRLEVERGPHGLAGLAFDRLERLHGRAILAPDHDRERRRAREAPFEARLEAELADLGPDAVAGAQLLLLLLRDRPHRAERRPRELAAACERELAAGELHAVEAQELRLDRIHLLLPQRDRGHERIVARVAQRSEEGLAIGAGQLRDGVRGVAQITRLAGHDAHVHHRTLARELAALAVEDRRPWPELARRPQPLAVAQLPVNHAFAP